MPAHLIHSYKVKRPMLLRKYNQFFLTHFVLFPDAHTVSDALYKYLERIGLEDKQKHPIFGDWQKLLDQFVLQRYLHKERPKTPQKVYIIRNEGWEKGTEQRGWQLCSLCALTSFCRLRIRFKITYEAMHSFFCSYYSVIWTGQGPAHLRVHAGRPRACGAQRGRAGAVHCGDHRPARGPAAAEGTAAPQGPPPAFAAPERARCLVAVTHSFSSAK